MFSLIFCKIETICMVFRHCKSKADIGLCTSPSVRPHAQHIICIDDGEYSCQQASIPLSWRKEEKSLHYNQQAIFIR